MNKKGYHISPQNDALVRHFLTTSRNITPMSAQVNYSIMRLASRISELKKEGFVFEDEMHNINGHRYKTYTYKGHRFFERRTLAKIFL